MHTTRPLLVLGLSAALGSAPGVALADSGSGHQSHQPPQASQGGGQSHDPRGNNGTVKISGIPIDGSHRNQPHVGCTFALKFFGFDANQTADITFTGQAPTKAGTLLSQHAVPISNDAAGGGKDADAVLTYTADQLGLSAITPAKQGWHVKVAVDVLQAPGGAKQKVFWLSCPSSAPATTGGAGTADTSTAGPTHDSAGTPDTVTPDTATAGGGTVTGGSTPTAGSGSVSSNGFTGGSGTVSLNAAKSTDAGAASASGSASRRAGLPFTGFALGSTLLAGFATIGAGAAALVAGRRRRTN